MQWLFLSLRCDDNAIFQRKWFVTTSLSFLILPIKIRKRSWQYYLRKWWFRQSIHWDAYIGGSKCHLLLANYTNSLMCGWIYQTVCMISKIFVKHMIYLLHTLQERPVIFKIVLLNKIIIALAMEKKHNRLPKNYFIWLVRMIIERPSMMTFYLIG